MGKGDQKTRRGKLFKGTFGVRRKREKDVAYKKVEETPEKLKDSKPEMPETKTIKKPAPAKKITKPNKTAEAKAGDKKNE